MFAILRCIILAEAINLVLSQLYVEFLNSNNGTFLDDRIVLSATGWGQVNPGVHADTLLFCIYESLDENPHVIRSGEEFIFPSHKNCWEPQRFSTGSGSTSIRITKDFDIFGYFGITTRYIAAFINTRAGPSEEFEIARTEIVVDVLDSISDRLRGAHVTDEQRHILTSSDVDLPARNSAMDVAVFMKDLEVHGANMRLVRFACSVCSSPDKWPNRVAFLLGASKGKLMSHISMCRCLIHVAPALTMEVLENAGGVVDIDASLVRLLSRFDVLLALNTHGDTQTDVLFGYIEFMRRQQGVQGHMGFGSVDGALLSKVPRVALDLCNVFDIEEVCRDRWQAVVDVLIAPSVFIGQHQTSIDARKRVEVVYPSLSETFEHNPVTCRPWPRRPNGKFQVGYFGRLYSVRSPGVFVRTVAFLFRSHSAEYILENFEFVVVGTGSGLNNTLSLARTLGVDRYIQFVGFVPQLIQSICTADLVVNPMTRGENFGIMQLEAMACGTPVLAFNRSASQESLHPLASHVLNEVSVEALADAIWQAYQNPEAFDWSNENFARVSAEVVHQFSPRVHAIRMLTALQND